MATVQMILTAEAQQYQMSLSSNAEVLAFLQTNFFLYQ